MQCAVLLKARQGRAGVSVKCATACGAKTIYAQRIVLAVPPRLVANAISFFPKLKPEQTQAMCDIPTWMAGQSKFTAVYSKPFGVTMGCLETV